MLTRDKANTTIWSRDGSCTTIPNEYGEEVVAHWMNGDTFYECRGQYGQRVVIKLAEVNQISVWTGSQVAAVRADERAQKAEDAISGV